ncbi:MAG: bifunctional pyr operon transcriptional regulator/uracil phosphoribosyltransferase PyrR [Chitinophagales bacterium]
MQSRIILDSQKFQLTIERLCHQLIENHGRFENSCIIGLQPRGVFLSQRILKKLNELIPEIKIDYGVLDTTFYRDDFRHSDKPLLPLMTEIDFIVENKHVILIDDVFYTGRTVRSGMDALLDFGRPSKIELLVLIDRRYSRQVPIMPDYVGKTVDAVTSEKVRVEWADNGGDDKVWIIPYKEEK